MCDEGRSAISATCRFSEECVARFTRRSFDRDFPFSREGANVCGGGVKVGLVFRRELSNKPRIGSARSSAQSMIKMANDQVFVTQTNYPVQEGYGIAPAGHTDQITCVWGKAPQQSCFYLNPIHESGASNFQNQSWTINNQQTKRELRGVLKL